MNRELGADWGDLYPAADFRGRLTVNGAMSRQVSRKKYLLKQTGEERPVQLPVC